MYQTIETSSRLFCSYILLNDEANRGIKNEGFIQDRRILRFFILLKFILL